MLSRDEIVQEARTWLGVRWRHQGRDRHGVDCAGLVACVAHGLGVPYPDITQYARQTDGELLLQVLQEYLVEKPVATAAPGDVFLMKHLNTRWAIHVGFVTNLYAGTPNETLGILHAYVPGGSHMGRVVEQIWDEQWRARVTRVFEIPGITKGG